MKIKLLLIFLLFFTLIFNVSAGKGKNNGNTRGFSTTSSTKYTTTYVSKTCYTYSYDPYYYTPPTPYECGNYVTSPYTQHTYCPAGEVLVESQQYQNPSLAANAYVRDGTLVCMKMDYDLPIITVNTNGYTDLAWTNKNVKLDISVTDNWIGLKKVWYSINGVNYVGSASFSLNFTEEGTYDLLIGAEDLSTHNGVDGSPTSIGNISEVRYSIKIDKSPMILNTMPDTNYNWRNSKPNISFDIVDKYKGESIEIKTFTCTGKPADSVWITPVATDGSLVGSCNPATLNCTLDSNYTPNPSSCSWKCIDGYTKGTDNLCYKDSIILSCDNTILPTGTYLYNKTNVLVSEGASTQSYWKTPAGVATDGNFISKYVYASNDYSPSVSSCTYDCREGYHLDSNKCVNDIAILCCKKDYPLTQSKNVGVNIIDCTDPVNSAHVACVPNPVCGGEFVKDVLKYWTGSEYDYETEGVTGVDTLSQACGLENIPNSDGETCNPGYYLVGEGTAAQVCERVPLGEWSGQENEKRNCTNKPNKSYYIAHTGTSGGNNDCPWACDANYNKNGNNCDGATQYVACTGKPTNASWNSVSNITQTWDDMWKPTNVGVYDTNSSFSRCRYECNWGYSWDGDSCELIVNGQCGSSEWDYLYNAPSTNLCTKGSPTGVVTNTNTFTWSCDGLNGGSDDSCTAYRKKDGQCGSSDGGTFSNKPNNNLCSSGSPSLVSGSGPWNWSCSGVNGGNDDYCSANKTGFSCNCGPSGPNNVYFSTDQTGGGCSHVSVCGNCGYGGGVHRSCVAQ